MDYVDSSTAGVIRGLFMLLVIVISFLVLKYVIAAGVREGMRKARADEKKETPQIGSGATGAGEVK